MQTQLLDGTWSLSSVDPSAIAKNCSYFSNINRLDMNIPGDVHSTLLNRGFIKDPYYAADELSTLWVGQNDWKIERDFTFKKSEGKVILSLTRVDTFACIILNGKEIANTDNFFARFNIDITDVINDGENHIEFIFTSAEKVAVKRNSELKSVTLVGTGVLV